MKATVKFPPNIRIPTGTDQTVIDLDEGAHLSDILEVLATRYGEGLINSIYTPELDSLDIWASVIVDGQPVPLPLTPKSDVKLKEGSVIVLIAPVSGG